jgi:RsmE family RNA methyltransferase
VNIILFHPSEVQLPLPRNDVRARHIVDVLRRKAGERFDAGLVNGARGKGTVTAVDEHHLHLAFAWEGLPPPLPPIALIVGLPRPPTARDILRDATTLGVGALHFARTERGETSYADSSLWKSGEWEQALIAGAAQAFCTRLPLVTHGRGLAEVVAEQAAVPTRLVLDNYEATTGLADVPVPAGAPVVLAIGAERGWSADERALFRQHGFTLVHLGQRVLRTETACLAALTLIRARGGWL